MQQFLTKVNIPQHHQEWNLGDMCQHRFINYNKRPTLLQDGESAGQEGGPREFATLTAQLCCEPKPAVKNKVH